MPDSACCTRVLGASPTRRTTPGQEPLILPVRCNNRGVDALIAVLVALVVIVAVWYGVASRSRRLAAEATMASLERELAQLIEATDEAFLSFDANGLITSWSSHAERLFGWSAADVLGQAMSDTIIPVLHRQAYANGLSNYRAGHDSAIVGKRVETAALHRDGHEFTVEMMIWASEAGGFRAFVTATSRHAVMGGLSALGAAMYSIGIPKNSVLQYETQVKNGKLLLVAHGTLAEVERAKDLLDQSDASSATVHGDELATVRA